jgi:hypothetical protein
MEAAIDFVGSYSRILLLPIMSFTMSSIFFVFWVITALLISSMGTASFNPLSPFPTIAFNPNSQGIMWYFVFCLLWVVSFLICY